MTLLNQETVETINSNYIEQDEDSEDEDDPLVNTCRICYGSSEEEELKTPCQCCGSVKYIHQSCLMTWLKSGATHCEICNTQYQFKKIVRSYKERKSPSITSWHLAWIIKELVVLDWFHFLETVVICISLMLINRMSSFDWVYQFALIGLVELFYYGLNIFSCIFLLYYDRWIRLNMIIHVLNYSDTCQTSNGFFIACFEKYRQLLMKNKRLKQVVDVIELNDFD